MRISDWISYVCSSDLSGGTKPFFLRHVDLHHLILVDRERDGSEAQMHQRLPNASKAFFDMPLLFGSGSLDFVIDHDADLHVLEIRCRGQCEARSGARVQARQFVTRNPLLSADRAPQTAPPLASFHPCGIHW